MGIFFKKFEDMKVYRLALELTFEIYRLFKENKDFDFKRQIQCASVSILNNIAEGFERTSNKAFINHLDIAKGSCGEVRSMLLLSNKLGYLSDKDCLRLTEMSVEIAKMLSGLMTALKKNT
ncbi:four helix bundle protein [Candidatus Uhrbacteria bacterium]|nr:four helix bundle protein [Candidatus Uhrbacteria bacterium]